MEKYNLEPYPAKDCLQNRSKTVRPQKVKKLYLSLNKEKLLYEDFCNRF